MSIFYFNILNIYKLPISIFKISLDIKQIMFLQTTVKFNDRLVHSPIEANNTKLELPNLNVGTYCPHKS